MKRHIKHIKANFNRFNQRYLVFSNLQIILALTYFSQNNHIIFPVFFGTFGAGSVPHIRFLNLQVFTVGISIVVFHPFSGFTEISFVHLAKEFPRQSDVVKSLHPAVYSQINIHVPPKCGRTVPFRPVASMHPTCVF